MNSGGPWAENKTELRSKSCGWKCGTAAGLVALLVLSGVPAYADESGLDASGLPLPYRYAWVRHDDTPVYAAPGDPAQMTPVRFMFSNMWVSIVEETGTEQEVWYGIGREEYVRGEDLWLAKPSAFQGIPLGDQREWVPGFVVGKDVNVRARPGAAWDNPPVGTLQYYDLVRVLEYVGAADGAWYRIGEGQYVHSDYVRVVTAAPRPDGVSPDDRWIAIDLAEQTLVAYEGERAVYATIVSTGLPWWATPGGLFQIQRKIRAGDMRGSGEDGVVYYLVQDVPWTMYFHKGYALHAAYWHDGFGHPRSRGCVNLSPRDAKWLFDWSTPTLLGEDPHVLASQDDPGTWVYVYSAPAEDALR